MSANSKMSDKEMYSHKDLPKISNYLLNGYRCFMKCFAMCIFGIGAVILAVFVFPFIRLSSKKDLDFGVQARKYVSHTFRNFLRWLQFVGVSIRNVDDIEKYFNLHNKIIVANHPSLLDFVYIMSLVPNSTCIVRGSLTRTPLRGVIKQAYITNTTTFEEMCVECKKITDKGCNVIIFPEGTRTPRHGQNTYKKGAARIALYCGCNIQPIFIGGSDKYGLGKHDPFWSYNHVEPLYYDFKMLPEISIDEFKTVPEQIAAKRLTEKMAQVIRSAGDEYVKNNSHKTYNNY